MKNMKITFYFMVIVFTLIQPLKAQRSAHEMKTDELMNLLLNELMNVRIITASKNSEKIQEAPATAYVISKEEIRQRGYVYLKDTLRDLPGMETIENFFSEMGTLVPVRGVVGNNKIVVLLNGVRLNPPGGEVRAILIPELMYQEATISTTTVTLRIWKKDTGLAKSSKL
jgi:outer membrane receptor for ferrienterochelin and colicin